MYYEPGKTAHGLPYDPFKSCVVPRPIGWISTVDRKGNANLAPYSQFQNIGFDPPMVMFSANQNTGGGRKDSVINAESTGQFVWNMATYALREAVNISAEEVPHGVDEFERAGLAKAPSRIVRAPRVADSPIQFECEVVQTVRLPGNSAFGTVDVVFGKVLAIHIADDYIDEKGMVDVLKMAPLARMGYYEYTHVTSKFSMVIPGNNEALRAGMEGSSDKVRAGLKGR
jgi:flavin reductase (DIM6/NTAB) family NADH-FMN oxidoreductase RutF